MRLPRLGSIVCVTFLDHFIAGHGEKPKQFRCRAWGRLVRRDKDSLTVRHWESECDGSRDHDNHEETTIVRRCVESVEVCG